MNIRHSIATFQVCGLMVQTAYYTDTTFEEWYKDLLSVWGSRKVLLDEGGSAIANTEYKLAVVDHAGIPSSVGCYYGGGHKQHPYDDVYTHWISIILPT